MTTAIKRGEEGTITLTITIPDDQIKKTREEVIDEATAQSELPGFRKGKAPREEIIKRLSAEKLQEEILKKLLPQGYIKAVEEHKLKPIMNPKIHVHKVEEGKGISFDAITCEMPEITLNDYKDAIKTLTAKSKIVIPGKENEKQEPNLDEIIRILLEKVDVKLPSILINQEADRLLAQTLDEIKRLGLSLDQYLSSTGRNAEELRRDYETKAANDIKVEFILQKISEDEKITVEQTEVEEAINKAKDPKEKENLEKNRYVLASILRQQKTLDFLKNL